MTLERRLRIFIRRAGSFLLDLLIVGVPILGVQLLLRRMELSPGAEAPPGLRQGWTFATMTLPAIAYLAVTVSALGASFGQRLLRMHVSRAHGEHRLPLHRSLPRAAILLAPAELILAGVHHGWGWAYFAAYAALGLLIFSIVLQREGRGLHDLASGARVVSGAA